MNNYLIKYQIFLFPTQKYYLYINKAMDNEEYSEREKDNYYMYLILLQLLKARGFTISEDKQNISEAQFKNRRRELEEDLFYKEDDAENEIIMAVKCNFIKKKITAELIEDFIKAMSEDKIKITHYFVVAATNPKTKGMQVEKSVELLQKTKDQVRIEIFHDQDLKFNLLEHDLVPKHIPLAQKQKQQLLQYYKVKLSQLPKLLHSDPVAKFLGLKRNQVVKIIRKSQTAGTYTTYRVVI